MRLVPLFKKSPESFLALSQEDIGRIHAIHQEANPPQMLNLLVS